MSHKPTERVLNIFNILASHPSGLTLTDISKALNIPKSTLSPILNEMTLQNFLYLNPENGLFTVGISTYYLSAAYDQTNELIPHLKSVMKHIAAETNEICQAGILDGSEVLYILKEEPLADLPIRIISYVGKRLPAHCTALGKALLLDYTLKDLVKVLPPTLESKTPNTITSISDLYSQLQLFRKEGICYECEEVTPHLCCYAIPISLIGKKKVALSVSIPLFRRSQEKINQIKKMLLDAKAEIEALI